MAITKTKTDIHRSEQNVLNRSFDDLYDLLATLLMGQDDGNNTTRRVQVDSNGRLEMVLMAEDVDSPGTFRPIQGQYDTNSLFTLLIKQSAAVASSYRVATNDDNRYLTNGDIRVLTGA